MPDRLDPCKRKFGTNGNGIRTVVSSIAQVANKFHELHAFCFWLPYEQSVAGSASDGVRSS